MDKIALIGIKLGMSSIDKLNQETACYTPVPCTLVQVLPGSLVGVCNYNKVFSLRIAGGRQVKEKKISKPCRGSHFKNMKQFYSNVREFRFNRRFEIQHDAIFNVGEYLEGRYIDVRGKTIGKGFQGPMKRHNFAGLNASHGVSVSHRSHGSVGLGRSWGSGVNKGKKMAGHMGSVNVVQKNLEILKVIPEKNLILIKGSVPGSDNTPLYLTDTNVGNYCDMISSVNNIPVKDLGGFN